METFSSIVKAESTQTEILSAAKIDFESKRGITSADVWIEPKLKLHFWGNVCDEASTVVQGRCLLTKELC